MHCMSISVRTGQQGICLRIGGKHAEGRSGNIHETNQNAVLIGLMNGDYTVGMGENGTPAKI
jgi:hypothetical protein